MTREEVASKVMKIVADLFGGEDIKEDMFLDTRGLGLSSIQFLTLILEVEEVLEVEFEDDNLNMSKYQTVGDCIDYIVGAN